MTLAKVLALEQGLVAAGELLQVLLLVAEDLHHLLALHHLFDEAVDAAQVPLLGHEVPAGHPGQPPGDEHHEGHHGQGQGRQGDAEEEHGHQHAGDGEDAVEELGDAHADHLLQGVDVVGVDGHDIPVGVGVEIPDGQGLHPPEQLVPQVPEGALGDVDHQPVLEEAGQHPAGVEEGHPGDGVAQAGEVRRLPRPDAFHHGQDVGVDQGPGEQGPLDHGKDADDDGRRRQDQVEPVLPPNEPQHPAQGAEGMLQLGPGPASGPSGAAVDRFGLAFRHQSPPPSSKSPPPPVWDS